MFIINYVFFTTIFNRDYVPHIPHYQPRVMYMKRAVCVKAFGVEKFNGEDEGTVEE